MSTSIDNRAEEIAQDLFGVVTQICLTALRGRRRPGDLKDIEFLTLSLLHAKGTMIVGDIQRLLGILPAQMSRVIRSLENRERPLIQCRINARDKRKIDVVLSPYGDKALLDYHDRRLGRLINRLRHLPDEDGDELVRVLHKLNALLEENG